MQRRAIRAVTVEAPAIASRGHGVIEMLWALSEWMGTPKSGGSWNRDPYLTLDVESDKTGLDGQHFRKNVERRCDGFAQFLELCFAHRG